MLIEYSERNGHNMKKSALALLSISFVIIGILVGFAASAHKHGGCKCCCCDAGDDETSVSDDDFVK